MKFFAIKYNIPYYGHNIVYYLFIKINGLLCDYLLVLDIIADHIRGALFLDINECHANTDRCQQECHNTRGSYTCSCRTGYRLRYDGRSCSGINNVII